MSPVEKPYWLAKLLEYIQGCGKKVILVARGGLLARLFYAVREADDRPWPLQLVNGKAELRTIQQDDPLPMLKDRELAESLADGGTLVIALGAMGSALRGITPSLMALPYLMIDLSIVLPHVDLIVHHGE